MNNSLTTYTYNPHNHIKIWLSSKPDIFLNKENQMRLIEMRETNPKDTIHLVYDSSLLNPAAINKMNLFCKEHRIIPIDIHQMADQLDNDLEKQLFQLYQDEITHLKHGGNLAVASDILRWLSPVFKKGAYTDFDVPVDTTKLPAVIEIKAPMLLNIGSLRTGNKELILSNNDYIAIVDPVAAKKDIENIQRGIINVLTEYTNDFIEKTEEEFKKGSFINKYLIGFMKNRSESIYISRSNQVSSPDGNKTSLGIRQYIKEVMSDKHKFLTFNKMSPEESEQTVIKRLRQELKNQTGLFKWLFFRKEYNEIKGMLKQSDDSFLDCLMKKERTLYLKSIVVCSTGPIAIAKFLFNGYVFQPKHFNSHISPYSFNHYGLKKSIKSQNSIALHESIFNMMGFLGAEDGKLNDSSWLETGVSIQQSREERLEVKRTDFQKKLPDTLKMAKEEILNHIKLLEKNSTGFWGYFFPDRKKEKIKALQNILTCFEKDTFCTEKLKKELESIKTHPKVYAGFFQSRTKKIIETLEKNCHTAIIWGFTSNRKIALAHSINNPVSIQIETNSFENEPHSSRPLGFFNAHEKISDKHTEKTLTTTCYKQ